MNVQRSELAKHCPRTGTSAQYLHRSCYSVGHTPPHPLINSLFLLLIVASPATCGIRGNWGQPCKLSVPNRMLQWQVESAQRNFKWTSFFWENGKRYLSIFKYEILVSFIYNHDVWIRIQISDLFCRYIKITKISSTYKVSSRTLFLSWYRFCERTGKR